jgi:hypothetical protein
MKCIFCDVMAVVWQMFTIVSEDHTGFIFRGDEKTEQATSKLIYLLGLLFDLEDVGSIFL